MNMRSLPITMILLMGVLICGICGSVGAVDEKAIPIIQKIAGTGKVTMGFRDSTPPFGFKEKGAWVGFGLDLGDEIHKALERKLEKEVKLVKVPVTADNRFDMITGGKVDIVIDTSTVTLAREELIDFSHPYFVTGARLMVSKDSGIKDYADLAGKKVGVGHGSKTNIQGIDRAMLTGMIRPATEKVLFDSHEKGFAALQGKKIDAYSADEIILIGLKGEVKNPDDWKIVGNYLTYEPYGMLLPQDQSNWRDLVNDVLIRMIKTGKFERIYDKWFGPKSVMPMPMSDNYKILLKALNFPE